MMIKIVSIKRIHTEYISRLSIFDFLSIGDYCFFFVLFWEACRGLAHFGLIMALIFSRHYV